ncbi:pantoate--beta-alanine ligase [bacterium]|nr:pantoate--beta-alanine ligase [bacterium]
MRVITTVSEMQTHCLSLKREGRRIGLVPTMGYLHQGHLSLFKALAGKCDVMTASIFVNPAQFGPNEDLDKYPRDFERDEKLLEGIGCDVLFYPTEDDMYPEGYASYIDVERLTKGLCGRTRKGHFRGMAAVVAKLFMITACDIAVFGQKDAQQAAVIKRMVRDLNFPVEIITAPIVREEDGLAMSSRNVYLPPKERKQAVCLHESLKLAEKLSTEGVIDSGIIIERMKELISRYDLADWEYIEIVDPHEMTPVDKITQSSLCALAVRIGDTRLIDNNIIGG